MTKEQEEQVKNLIVNGLCIDGAHHKQWCLWQIAIALGLDFSDQWDEERSEPEEGIPW